MKERRTLIYTKDELAGKLGLKFDKLDNIGFKFYTCKPTVDSHGSYDHHECGEPCGATDYEKGIKEVEITFTEKI